MSDRLIRIDTMNSGFDGTDSTAGIAGCTHHELREIHWSLKIIDENRRLRRFPELGLARIGDYAHDFCGIPDGPTEIQLLTDRIPIWKVSPDKFLVNHDDTWRVKPVARFE